MERLKYASIESQLGNAPCLCEDTEEIFWLKQSDDYESRVKLGNLLAGQYRFREAIDAYHTAEIIRSDAPMLYIRLGGAHLTLRNFEEAESAYKKSIFLGSSEKDIAYYMGVWHYLKREYMASAESFLKVLPCDDGMRISIIYWNSLCTMREGVEDRLIETYSPDMEEGHHTAYRDAVEVFLGNTTADEAIRKAQEDKNDLNAVIAMYGISVYLEHMGKNEAAEDVTHLLLKRESVWPCISYLAAWGDGNSCEM